MSGESRYRSGSPSGETRVWSLRARLTWMRSDLDGVGLARGGTTRPRTGARWAVGDRRATASAAARASAGRRHAVRRGPGGVYRGRLCADHRLRLAAPTGGVRRLEGHRAPATSCWSSPSPPSATTPNAASSPSTAPAGWRAGSAPKGEDGPRADGAVDRDRLPLAQELAPRACGSAGPRPDAPRRPGRQRHVEGTIRSEKPSDQAKVTHRTRAFQADYAGSIPVTRPTAVSRASTMASARIPAPRRRRWRCPGAAGWPEPVVLARRSRGQR